MKGVEMKNMAKLDNMHPPRGLFDFAVEYKILRSLV